MRPEYALPLKDVKGLRAVLAPNEGIGGNEGVMRESDRSATQLGVAAAPPEHEETPVVVDISLIDEMLRLTPAQRLRQNDRVASLAVRLRQAFAVRGAACPKRET
jgi:hypothetical protein